MDGPGATVRRNSVVSSLVLSCCVLVRGLGGDGSSLEEEERSRQQTRVDVTTTCQEGRNTIQTRGIRRWKTCPSEPSHNSRKN